MDLWFNQEEKILTWKKNKWGFPLPVFKRENFLKAIRNSLRIIEDQRSFHRDDFYHLIVKSIMSKIISKGAAVAVRYKDIKFNEDDPIICKGRKYNQGFSIGEKVDIVFDNSNYLGRELISCSQMEGIFNAKKYTIECFIKLNGKVVVADSQKSIKIEDTFAVICATTSSTTRLISTTTTILTDAKTGKVLLFPMNTLQFKEN